MSYSILKPATVLVLWSLVMLLWMSALRIPELRKSGIDLRSAVGGRGVDLDGVVSDAAQWKSHNYNHLMEQPTLFYAVVMVLALAAPHDALSVWLAWAYVGLRIIHSLYQAIVNVVLMRSIIFTLGSLVLIAMALRAAVLVF